jgi:hypothetical protein
MTHPADPAPALVIVGHVAAASIGQAVEMVAPQLVAAE